MLEELLSPEERMLRDAVRKYSQEQLLPRVLRANRHEGTTPPPPAPQPGTQCPPAAVFLLQSWGLGGQNPIAPLTHAPQIPLVLP